jgi:hypothetical protein
MPRLLVFDQFEELFTVYPDRWRERRPFFEEIARAVEDDPLLRTIVALREDYVAELDPYASIVPGSLRTRFRLERLGREAALSAVTEPAALTSRSYALGAAEILVEDLLKMRVGTGRDESAEVEGQFVEPVQLQVVCHSLWSTLPPEVEEITAEHLGLFGDVDEVLSRFYSDAVAAAAVAGGTSERELRTKLEQMFITPIGTRGIVYAGATETGGIPNPAIEELERHHLLRGDYRAGTRWLELTHDRLIEPIRASNRERAAAAQAQRVRKLTRAAIVLAIALAASFGIWLWTFRSENNQMTRPPHRRFPVLVRVVVDPKGAGRVTSARSRLSEAVTCGSVCAARFEQGERVQLIAEAAPGSTFIRWTGAPKYCASANICNFPALRVTSMKAAFGRGPSTRTELVAAADIAKRLRISPARVSALMRSSGFPRPVGRLGGSDIWRWISVERWARKQAG